MSDPTDISDELGALLKGAVEPKVLGEAKLRGSAVRKSRVLIDHLTHVGYGLMLVGLFAVVVSVLPLPTDPLMRVSFLVYGFVTAWSGARRLDRANRARRRAAKEFDGSPAPSGSVVRFRLRPRTR